MNDDRLLREALDRRFDAAARAAPASPELLVAAQEVDALFAAIRAESPVPSANFDARLSARLDAEIEREQANERRGGSRGFWLRAIAAYSGIAAGALLYAALQRPAPTVDDRAYRFEASFMLDADGPSPTVSRPTGR